MFFCPTCILCTSPKDESCSPWDFPSVRSTCPTLWLEGKISQLETNHIAITMIFLAVVYSLSPEDGSGFETWWGSNIPCEILIIIYSTVWPKLSTRDVYKAGLGGSWGDSRSQEEEPLLNLIIITWPFSPLAPPSPFVWSFSTWGYNGSLAA